MAGPEKTPSPSPKQGPSMPVKRAEWAPGMRQRGLTKHRHFAPPGRGVRYDQASGEDTRSTWLVGMTCSSPEGVNAAACAMNFRAHPTM
jgi:hypothetical protein